MARCLTCGVTVHDLACDWCAAGSSSGIGKAVALAFATQASADNKSQTKICVMSRSKTRLQAVVDEIEKLGAQGFAVAGDLTKGSDCQSAVEEAVSGQACAAAATLYVSAWKLLQAGLTLHFLVGKLDGWT